MTLEAFLAENAHTFGFSCGVQSTAAVQARLEAEERSLVERALTPPELDLFDRLRVPKRRVEWLAGRLAAKAAFAHHLGRLAPDRQDLFADASSASVLNRPSRAPFIQGHPELCLSISHSGAYAVAVIATFPIGVDVEKIEPRPPLFARFFLCESERHALSARDAGPMPSSPQSRDPAAPGEVEITWLWSRKEAVAKYLQVGGAIPFNRIDVSGEVASVIVDANWRIAGGCLDASAASIRLVSGRCDPYWISLAL